MEAIEWLLCIGFASLAVYGALLLEVLRKLYRPATIPMLSHGAESGGLGGLSVVVPYRNESTKLPDLIERIKNLIPVSTLPTEVIWVDDHSTDGFDPQNTKTPGNFRFYRLEGSQKGKKSAIDLGVKMARYPWIMSLDAGSRPQENLLQNLAKLRPGTLQMLLFLIRPMPRQGFATKFFDLEFLALQGVGLAEAISRKAILANGAAMLFRKEAYLAVHPMRKDLHLASGDDVFLLAAVKSHFGADAVAPVWGDDFGYVNVQFPGSLKALFAQRLRWISKNSAVPDARFRRVSLTALLSNLIWIVSVVFACATGYWNAALGLFLVKFGVEVPVLMRMARLTDRRDCIPWIFSSVIIYPIYLSILVAFGFFTRGKYSND